MLGVILSGAKDPSAGGVHCVARGHLPEKFTELFFVFLAIALQKTKKDAFLAG